MQLPKQIVREMLPMQLHGRELPCWVGERADPLSCPVYRPFIYF